MLLILFMLPIEPSPGIPANGIIDASGFLGSKEPRPGKLESKFAFNPARPEKFAIAAAELAALDDDCFLLDDDVDDDWDGLA